MNQLLKASAYLTLLKQILEHVHKCSMGQYLIDNIEMELMVCSRWIKQDYGQTSSVE